MTHPRPSSRSRAATTLPANSARSIHRSSFLTVRGLSGLLCGIHSATRVANRYRSARARRMVTHLGCAAWTRWADDEAQWTSPVRAAVTR